MIYLGASGLYFRSLEDCGYGSVDTGDDVVVTDETLSQSLGLPSSAGLYEIFSFFFEGDVRSDFEMLEAIFNGLLLVSDFCFCLNVGSSFSWFALVSGRVKKLGEAVLGEDLSLFEIGRFYKTLRFRAAMLGYRLGTLYSDSSLLGYASGSLQELMWGYPAGTALMMMSSHFTVGRAVTASALVDVMGWHFRQDAGKLFAKGKIYKDFSNCTSTITGYSDCSYGVIIDCEGKIGMSGSLSDGCRELGGLIWCRRKEILVSVEQFSCDEVLFEDTLIRVMRSMRSLSGGKKFSVLTFGKSDKKMFESSLKSLCSARVFKQVSGTFRFVDCKRFIDSYVSDMEQKATLSNIARHLGVLVLTPRHKALNDARTLLNVLAMLLFKTGDFVI